MNKIDISEKDEKITLKLSEGMTWPTALRILASSIRQLANITADAVYNMQPEEQKTDEVMVMIKSDIADMINFLFSNILNELSPKDPDLQLSEVAIATMENEIIHKAAKEGKTIQEALKEYEEKLKESEYAAKPNAVESLQDALDKKDDSEV